MIDLSKFSTHELASVLGKRRRAKQVVPPRAKVLRPCPHCGVELGARELRKHLPGCRRETAAASERLRLRQMIRPVPVEPPAATLPPDLRSFWERSKSDPFWMRRRRRAH